VALARLSARLRPSDLVAESARRLDRLAGRLAPALRGLVQGRETGLDRLASRLAVSSALTLERRRARLGQVAAGLRPARLHQGTARGAERLEAVLRRLSAAAARPTAERRARLDALERLRQTLGYRATLGRGYAVVRGDGHVVTTVPAAAAAARLEIEFGDGRLTIGAGTPTPAPKPDPAPAPKPRQKPPETPGGQGSLF
jgi:exodeoxyribonuclease VII large subunit